jgi:uncharacterized damage-inducible protein DinB
MMDRKVVINEFSSFSTWVSSLREIDESLWKTPISVGKWSISEIAAHILFWDKYLLSNIVPAVRNERGMEFPDFDTYNKNAIEYVKSDITKNKLLNEIISTRELLVKELNEMPDEKLTKPLTANGETHCKHTGTPYSLLYIIQEFIDHDKQHKNQIIHYVNEA